MINKWTFLGGVENQPYYFVPFAFIVCYKIVYKWNIFFNILKLWFFRGHVCGWKGSCFSLLMIFCLAPNLDVTIVAWGKVYIHWKSDFSQQYQMTWWKLLILPEKLTFMSSQPFTSDVLSFIFNGFSLWSAEPLCYLQLAPARAELCAVTCFAHSSQQAWLHWPLLPALIQGKNSSVMHLACFGLFYLILHLHAKQQDTLNPGRCLALLGPPPSSWSFTHWGTSSALLGKKTRSSHHRRLCN